MTEQEKKLVEAWLLVSDYCNSFGGGHEGCVFRIDDNCALNHDGFTEQLREQLKKEKGVESEMISAKVWKAWGDAKIDVVSVDGKLYFGSGNDMERAKMIKNSVIEAGMNSASIIFRENEKHSFSNPLWNRIANFKMIDLERENDELRKADSARPVLPIPVTKFVRETTADSQFKHIIEECGEVAKELRNGNTEKAALELGDVVTSCFTMFEILGYDEAARSEIFRQTNEKNRARNYFEVEGIAE